MAITILADLDEAHDKQAAAIVTKTLDNLHWRINPNDVGWVYHWPQKEKQLGRSKRVFWQLMNRRKGE